MKFFLVDKLIRLTNMIKNVQAKLLQCESNMVVRPTTEYEKTLNEFNTAVQTLDKYNLPICIFQKTENYFYSTLNSTFL